MHIGDDVNGWSIYSTRGEIYHGSHWLSGPIKSYRTSDGQPPSYVSVIYNADTKQLSWKSNETEWENSHVVETSEEYDNKVWFAMSVVDQTKFEIELTDWVKTKSSPFSLSQEFVDRMKYVDIEKLNAMKKQ
jgi:hypothetical protein